MQCPLTVFGGSRNRRKPTTLHLLSMYSLWDQWCQTWVSVLPEKASLSRYPWKRLPSWAMHLLCLAKNTTFLYKYTCLYWRDGRQLPQQNCGTTEWTRMQMAAYKKDRKVLKLCPFYETNWEAVQGEQQVFSNGWLESQDLTVFIWHATDAEVVSAWWTSLLKLAKKLCLPVCLGCHISQ